MLSPEFQYRPGLVPLTEDSTGSSHVGSSGPPNRPLPPTPDDDGDTQGDRTLIMKRVSVFLNILFYRTVFVYWRNFVETN